MILDKNKKNYNELLKELKLDLIEIKAYRRLQNYEQDNFGFEYDDNEDTSYIGSEDAYYEMDEQYLEDMIIDYKNYIFESSFHVKSKKTKLNRYDKKQITKTKLKKLLANYSRYYVVYDNGIYIERHYLSSHNGDKVSRAKTYKRISNKRVRNSKNFKLKGRNYTKVFDYWCEID